MIYQDQWDVAIMKWNRIKTRKPIKYILKYKIILFLVNSAIFGS